MDNKQFKGIVGRTYVLQGDRVLIMKSYEGDIAPGDVVEVELPTGNAAITIKKVAWGSAFNAESPPLTLIVDPVDAAIATGSRLLAPSA